MPVSPKKKYWASVDYTFPKFLPLQGDVWTRFSYSWQGKTWDSLTAIEDNDREFLIPAVEDPARSRLGFTSENGGWDAALIVRNVFDDSGLTWLSSTNRGELFDDPRWRYVRGLQRPETYRSRFTKKW